MIKGRIIDFFHGKRGNENISMLPSFLFKFLLALAVGLALYFMIRGTGNAFLPK